ncbi:methionyl-tRNA formyltransferase [Candidatus Bipolaricaulota sp. J31]
MKALAERGWVVAAITQPDRPAGRGLQLTSPPVKLAAQELGLPLFQPRSINKPDSLAYLRGLAPDLIVVAAFGQLLKKAVLELPRYGCINVHASLLPKYRGAAPIQWAIIRGERWTGVTTVIMDEGMDTGPILLQRAVRIGEDETAGELAARLAELGAELIVETVEGYLGGRIRPKPQPPEGTLAPKITEEHARIDWTADARTIHNLVRGLAPAPGAYTTFRGKRVKIHRTKPLPGAAEAAPGEILPHRKRLLVATGDGVLEVLSLTPAGKREIRGADFLNGYRPRPGERFV